MGAIHRKTGKMRRPQRKAGRRGAARDPAKPKDSKKRRLAARSDDAAELSSRGLDVVDDFAAMRRQLPGAHDTSAVTTRWMEVYEWIGDAVIGELVTRCLLSQFHVAPLSARVFRNLRLGVVTNENLAMVFDHMGYQRRSVEPRLKRLKEKADVVEAIAGELVTEDIFAWL
ncbi:hypothetical protein ATCC90586_009591 [Pythium insidiosum]|nr:hypothetical protein ATCC90586_009591 [Pythium insidiosum]